jgi:hypothetical protein
MYIHTSLVFSKSIAEKEYIKDAYGELAVIDNATANYKAEAEDYKMYFIYRDSIENEDNTKKQFRQR